MVLLRINGQFRIDLLSAPSFQALYTAADAVPYHDFGLGSANHGTIVRGQAPRRARHAPEGCPVPRDLAEIDRWLSGGFEDSP